MQCPPLSAFYRGLSNTHISPNEHAGQFQRILPTGKPQSPGTITWASVAQIDLHDQGLRGAIQWKGLTCGSHGCSHWSGASTLDSGKKALSEKDPIMGESGAEFTELSLNTKPGPDAPEAHLGNDANPNMSTLARTGVGALAKVNTTRHISDSLQSSSPHLPLSSPTVTTVHLPLCALNSLLSNILKLCYQ